MLRRIVSFVSILKRKVRSNKSRIMANNENPVVDDLSVCNQTPVIVILGSTATGKTKLAIEIASKFGGEIISADSMQVYEGLDILTNKATVSEMNGIRHHMIGVIDRTEKFDVTHFRDRALPLVEKLLGEKKIPLIVGGTNYYIESLLWQVLLDTNKNNPTSSQSKMYMNRKRKAYTDEVLNSEKAILANEMVKHSVLVLMQETEGNVTEADIGKWTNQELYLALGLVDPERTSKLHPNDRRKVFRSLQVRFQTGRKHSDLIAEQCAALADEDDGEALLEGKDGFNVDTEAESRFPRSTALGGPLRFANCFCLWIQADKEILCTRIEERVAEMVDRGLRKELDSFIDAVRESKSLLNYEEGILQAIGLKEFHSYLQITPLERYTENGNKLFTEGTERLKVVTKQYAKKQLKWINQRFLRPSRRQVPPVYRLDGNSTNPEEWERCVTSVAVDIVRAHLDNRLESPVLVETKVQHSDEKVDDDLIARTCDVCDNRVLIGKTQWEIHVQSARHRRMAKKKKAEKLGLEKPLDEEKHEFLHSPIQ